MRTLLRQRLARLIIPVLLAIYMPIIALATTGALLFTTAAPAQAATQPLYTTTLGEWWSGLKGKEYNKQVFDFQSLIGVLAGLATMLLGCTDETVCPSDLEEGAIHTTTTVIAGLYASPPASGVYYAANIGERLRLVKPAYAQDSTTGFKVLGPFLNVWRAVRNLTYILFVVGIVGLGLAIMFRAKISPQAVITIQSALPRAIIALLLITFSYAIIGFLIDIMYLIFGLLVWGLSTNELVYNDKAAGDYFLEFTNAGFPQTLSFIVTKGFEGMADVVTGIPESIAPEMSGGLAGIAGDILSIVIPAGVAIVAGTAMIPIVVGLAIAIIAFFIRVLFILAKAYLLLLLYLIFGPILILWAALSGKGVWEGWLKGVLANLLVFLFIGVIIFLVELLIAQINTADSGIWGPPYIGQNPQIIKGIIALGGVMLLVTVPDIINQILDLRQVPLQTPGGDRQAERIGEGLGGGIKSRFTREGGGDIKQTGG